MQVSHLSDAHAGQAANNGTSPAKAARAKGATPGQAGQPFGQIVSMFARDRSPTPPASSATADNAVAAGPADATTSAGTSESAGTTGSGMSSESSDASALVDSNRAATDLIA